MRRRLLWDRQPAPGTAAEKTTSPAAPKFWEDVDGAGSGEDRAGTLTWEEAAKLGLIPPKE